MVCSLPLFPISIDTKTRLTISLPPLQQQSRSRHYQPHPRRAQTGRPYSPRPAELCPAVLRGCRRTTEEAVQAATRPARRPLRRTHADRRSELGQERKGATASGELCRGDGARGAHQETARTVAGTDACSLPQQQVGACYHWLSGLRSNALFFSTWSLSVWLVFCIPKMVEKCKVWWPSGNRPGSWLGLW